MPGVTVKHIDDLDSYEGQGRFLFAAKGLGLTSVGLSVQRWPAGYSDYPEHDHAKDTQEEVYFVLEGSVALEAEGERHELAPGTFARVEPDVRRKLVPGPEGVTLLALGGRVGAFAQRSGA